MEKVKTKEHGTWEHVDSEYWGEYFRPSTDDEGHNLTLAQLKSFQLRSNFPKLPNQLMRRIISLMKQYFIEVQVVLIRNETDKSLWKVLVPLQLNNGPGSVDKADLMNMIDIETGQHSKGIPFGWVFAGSAHLHPNMSAFWSGTDDESELNRPGLHFTIGGHNWDNKKTYTICASICLNGVRHVVEPSWVIDIEAHKKASPLNTLIKSGYKPARSSGYTTEEYVVNNHVMIDIPHTVNSQIAERVYAPLTYAYPIKGNAYNQDPYNGFNDFSKRYNLLEYAATDLNDVQQVIEDYILENGNYEELKRLLEDYTRLT